MKLGRVCGSVVSTVKSDGFGVRALLLVVELDPKAPGGDARPGDPYVATDLVGAGDGEVVLITNGSAARVPGGYQMIPTDAAIVGIVDSVKVDGSTTFRKQ